MADKKNTRRGSILLFAGVFTLLVAGGTAVAVVQQAQSTRQAGSATATVSSCDTEYRIALGAPSYSVAANDYVISSASTDRLSEDCEGQTLTITVLREDGSVVSDGSAVIPSNGFTTVNFGTPLPVAQTYKLASAIYGRDS
jgi:hypothetical protein